jgi:hypothetical protein
MIGTGPKSFILPVTTMSHRPASASGNIAAARMSATGRGIRAGIMPPIREFKPPCLLLKVAAQRL